MTSLPALPRGLAIYVPIALARPDQLEGAVARLTSARASIAAIMVEGLPFKAPKGPVTPRLSISDYTSAVRRFRARGIECIGVSFPDVDGDLDTSRAHLRDCRSSASTRGQLDAEANAKGSHWSRPLVQLWRDDDPELSITSTRHELPYLGPLDCELWLQLEQQTSTKTLDKALAIAAKATSLDRVVCVGGLFDDDNDPRTPDEIRADLAACSAQTRRSGRFAEWSAKSLGGAKAGALASWVLTRPFG